MNFRTHIIMFFGIALATTSAYNSLHFQSKPVITLFSHGIADSYKQAYLYAKSYIKQGITHFNERFLIHTPYVSFNYPDATDKFYRVNWTETSFGQENEIGRLHLAYQRTMNRYQDCDIILWGLSRGASNQSIFAGLYNHYDNIRAILLESPYNSMTEVIESMMHKKNLGWMPVSYGETLAEFIFKKYKRNGWSPKDYINKISKEIPILIICSKEDQTVPYTTSINVYKNLVAAGHKHTYILITDYGRHAQILQGPDGETYQSVVNAFYKKYNLPYCPISAAQGESLLALCQPNL
jgi:prolyl oligopeptidase family protein